MKNDTVFMAIGMSNPQLYVNINNIRELLINENNDLRFNFRDFDYTNKIKLTANDNTDGYREVEIEPVSSEKIAQSTTHRQRKPEEDDRETLSTDTSFRENVVGLKYKFRKGNARSRLYESTMIAAKDGIKLEKDKRYKERLNGRFMTTATLLQSLANHVDRVQKSKKKERLISVLQLVEPRVLDITVSMSGLVYVDIGISQLVPINLLGDGFRKACAIIAGLLVLKDGFLMIDEIENGLHRDTQYILWKALIEASYEFNVQLFLATHSYEAIQVLVNTIIENDYQKNDLRVYSMQRAPSGEHKCYKYKFDNLTAAIESEVDVRGGQLL